MSGFGDFGSSYSPPMSGIPVTLGGALFSGGGGTTNSVTCPDGNTCVLLGLDCYGSGDVTAFINMGLANDVGDGFWSGQAVLDSPVYENGVSWRGAIPFGPGTNLEFSVSISSGGLEAGILGWGVLLPFVVPIL